MAIIYSSTFGKISGKHGNAVAAVRKKDGMVILKEYRPASNPNTEGQKNQRGKFGFVMKELNCMRKLFTLTFDGQYGINKVVSAMIKMGVSGNYPDFVLDYSKLVVSTGKPDNVQVTCTLLLPGTIEIKWDTTLFNGMNEKDRVNLVFLNPQLKVMDFRPLVSARNAGKVSVELPELLLKSTVHCWIYFTTENGNQFFASQYVGVMF